MTLRQQRKLVAPKNIVIFFYLCLVCSVWFYKQNFRSFRQPFFHSFLWGTKGKKPHKPMYTQFWHFFSIFPLVPHWKLWKKKLSKRIVGCPHQREVNISDLLCPFCIVSYKNISLLSPKKAFVTFKALCNFMQSYMSATALPINWKLGAVHKQRRQLGGVRG